MKYLAAMVVLVLAVTACGRFAANDSGSVAQDRAQTPADTTAASTPASTPTDEPAAEPTPAPTATSVPAQTIANTKCDGSLEGCFTYNEMDQYLNAIIPMVDQYFETAYPDVATPRDIVLIPNGRVARTYCGVSTSEAYEYCTGDQTIYIGQDLIWAFYRQAGDAAPAVALAHEWGHHLQNMLGVPYAQTRSDAISYENQADCISGAWAAYANDQQWLETDDDIGDIQTLLELIGSRESRARDHGTTAEREEAFNSSYEGGIVACNAYFPGSPVA